MKCTETRSIREMDEQRWDSVTGDVLSMTHRWLRVMETCWRSYGPRYLLLEDQQGPCIAVIANTVAAFENLGPLGWFYQQLSLAVSPPFSSMCGVMTRPGTSLESVMPYLEPVLSRLCRQEKRLLLTIDNLATSDLLSWQKAGFLTSPQQGLNILDLPSTYDLYLKSLYPKDRSELRRIRKRVAEFDIHFEVGPLANDGEQIYALLCEVFATHGTSPDAMPFTPQFFTGLEREMPGNVLFIRGYVGETLAGVSLCLLNGSTLWWPMAGLRYEIARPTYLYFLLMDEMIQWSIEHGIKKIFGGKTAEREKQRHGFHLEERWLCYRASIRPLNWAFSIALPIVKRLMRH
jgi:predicted N-acyltransferase